jgi:MoaA/NifB/PqqE/SkfB family radical SAM enzyme
MFLTRRLLDELRGRVDVLAISLDGVPDSHNRLRASELAFSKMSSRLEGLRASGIPFGFIFTLTQHNLGELDWVAQFALAQGARLLQIHPLEQVGRARELLEGQTPDGIENGFAYLEALRIQELAGDRMLVQVDVLESTTLPDNRERVYADELPADVGQPLGALLSPLVIETDGTVVPLEYGFNRSLALGNLHEHDLRTLAAGWRGARQAEFRRVCADVYERMAASTDAVFANWYEEVARQADLAAAR